ncbi:MAG: hypothetical protein AB1898_17195 [Acidobacteriota bacterium]
MSGINRFGKSDLFAPTTRKPLDSANKGNTASEVSEVEKVMVMLTSRQLNALDQICLEIRQATGIKVKRSLLIRSLIDGFLQTPHNFSDARSLADISSRISKAFRFPSKAASRGA